MSPSSAALLWTISAALGGPALAEVPGSSVHARHALERPGQGRTLPAPPPMAQDSGPDVTVYGYHPYWGPDPTTLDFARLSHLAIFNVDLELDGTLSQTSHWTDVAAEVVPLAHSHGVQVHLCITGFEDDVLNAVLPSASKRAVTVAALAELVDAYGADGVNVDFEGMDASNKQHLVDFVVELKAVVDEVVLATPAVDWQGAYDYDQLAIESDGLFIMGYGYHWKGGNPGPVAPLYGGDPWSAYSLEWTVLDYLDNGAPHDKIILGLPLYGNEWPVSSATVPGTASDSGWAVIMSDAVVDADTYGRSYDETTLTPYTQPPGTQLWYDDADSVGARIEYAVDMGIQGVGFWALGYEVPELWPLVEELTTMGPSPEEGDEVPVALAGISFLAYPGDTILLDGSGSYDPEGVDLLWQWTQVGGPEVKFAKADSATPEFVAQEPGTHSFELVVSDGVQGSQPDVVDVIVVDPEVLAEEGGGCSVVSGAPAGGAAVLALVGILGLARRREEDQR